MAKLARTLRILRDDNINIKWPERPRALDGWIGDEWHQQRQSDHNPNKRDTVDAIDVDSGRTGDTPIHVPTAIAAMIMHPSTHYVIHKRRIMHREDDFLPHEYTGDNPHDKHIHDSIQQTAAAENSVIVYKFILKPMKWPLLERGSRSNAVKELQAYLIGHGYGVAADGDFGQKTTKAVIDFQRRTGIGQDGRVGPLTRAKLRPFA
jgi:hypothetical protein